MTELVEPVDTEQPAVDPGTTLDPDSAERPALTIHIHSWATPVVGLLMLVIGLLGGYFGRPLLAPQAAASPSPVAAAVATADPQTEADQAANRAALMDLVLSQTRHFIGDENAPVVIIEYSDFQ